MGAGAVGTGAVGAGAVGTTATGVGAAILGGVVSFLGMIFLGFSLGAAGDVGTTAVGVGTTATGVGAAGGASMVAALGANPSWVLVVKSIFEDLTKPIKWGNISRNCSSLVFDIVLDCFCVAQDTARKRLGETRIGKKINLDPIVLSTKSLLGITAIAVAAHYGYCGPVWLAMGVLRQ